MWAKALSCVVLVAWLATPSQASAGAAEAPTDIYTLKGKLTVDVIVTSAATTTWLLSESVLKAPLSPDTCRWCQANGIDQSIRTALVWDPHGKTANTLSNVGLAVAALNAFGSLQLLALMDDRPQDAGLNSLYVLETLSITMVLTNAVKSLAGRERPAVHFDSSRAADIAQGERNISFFSGHSSFAFCLASAAGSVASLRGYRYAPWLWSVGLTVAGFTAYARVAADAHYASDVLIGATVGTLMGTFIPRWLHGRDKPSSTEGRAMALAWQPLLLPTTLGGALFGVQGAL